MRIGGDTESCVLKRYYEDNVMLMSAEGVLKVLSIILCLASSLLQMTSASCTGTTQLASVVAYSGLVAAALLACLFSGVAISINHYAPTWWLFTDMLVSTVVGGMLLVVGVLSLAVCSPQRTVDFLPGPLGIINSSMIVASAVVAYVSLTRRWDASARALQFHPPPLSVV